MLPFGIVMAGLGLALLIRSLRAIQAGTTVTLETTTST
jgi:hypothetical protein